MGSFMRRAALAASLLLVPSFAFAHPGLPHVHDAATGLVYPIGDYVLALVAGGVFAALFAARAFWRR
jgi:hydrogenase/urease accessory protein HupE